MKIFLLFLLLTVSLAHANDESSPQLHTDTWNCGPYEIQTIQLCHQVPGILGVACYKQNLQAAKNGQQALSIDLLKAEKRRNEGHRVFGYICLPDAANKSYLLVRYDNGGNCSDCEFESLLSLDERRWLMYKNRWNVATSQRKALSLMINEWRQKKRDFHDITVTAQHDNDIPQ